MLCGFISKTAYAGKFWSDAIADTFVITVFKHDSPLSADDAETLVPSIGNDMRSIPMVNKITFLIERVMYLIFYP